MNFLSRAASDSSGPAVMEDQVYELNCRRCGSEELLELARLAGDDHAVYRCRDCGFLFSPPDGSGAGSEIEQSPLRRRPAYRG